MTVFVFDIETIPDVEAGRRLLDLEQLSDADVAAAMAQWQRQRSGGSDFLPHYLHKIVAISVVLRAANQFKVWSLGTLDADESELIRRFFDGLAKYTPTLVSWNGGGFDLPVLHYRALHHGVASPTYWETGDTNNQFRWNNYLNRYHERHTDLMDCLAGYQTRANAPLDGIATLLGFPGKMGKSGAHVWQDFLAGDLAGIRNYCETDVLNTYLVYCRYQLMRGQFSQDTYQQECDLIKNELQQSQQPHLHEFLQQWNQYEQTSPPSQ